MKIIIAGDFAPSGRLAKQVEERKFSEIFTGNIVNIIGSVDYSLVNLECPITDNSCKPITKCGPNLKCTKEAQNRGMLPSFVNKKWIPILSNVIICEAHRDKLTYFLNRKIKEE